MSGKPTVRDYVQAYRDAQLLEAIWEEIKDRPDASKLEPTFQRSIQRAKDEAEKIRTSI